MENFINKIKEQREEDKLHGVSDESPEIPYFIRLEQFKKEVISRKSWIEEFMLDGDYEKAKGHLVWIGTETCKLYEELEEVEKIEEDCGCIHNITKEEFNVYLKSIGGLENGYGERYNGYNRIRNFFFDVTNWILWRLPYYQKTKTFSKESGISIFVYNIFYWMFKWLLKDKKPKNPFRSKIFDAGYFSIGPGWYGLVKTLIEKAIEKGWDKEICQVKEKFGGLRFYINGAPREVFDVISEHEKLSYKICEECGSAGAVRTGGWIRTLCDEHYKSE